MRDGGKSGGKARQKPAKFSLVPKTAEKSATEICQANKKKGVGAEENALKIYAAPAGGKRQEQEQGEIPKGAACHRRLGGRGRHCLQAPTFVCFFSLFLFFFVSFFVSFFVFFTFL